MYFFQRTGLHLARFIHSILFFFSFIGHVSHSVKNVFSRHLKISWHNVLKVLYYSGTTIVFPLIIISALMGVSLGFNTYNIFSKFNLQEKALPIAQTLLIQDLMPLLIGFVLCVQVSLNIINARIKITKYKQTPQDVILEHILPIIIGINFTGMLLYIYLLMAISISLYITFHDVLNVDTHTFLFQVVRPQALIEMLYSLSKTLIYCTIVSLAAGYYYYQVAIHQVPLRKAVSRILTRGSLWLTMSSVYLKFLNF